MILKDSPEHKRYMRSALWRATRSRVIDSAGWQCSVCKRRSTKLQVHHLTYDRLGCERDEDLAVLCARCHRRVSTY